MLRARVVKAAAATTLATAALLGSGAAASAASVPVGTSGADAVHQAAPAPTVLGTEEEDMGWQ